MPNKVRILLAGGGSGGHIIPNLAVASAIKAAAPEAEILYVASRGRLDADLLEPSGLRYKQIFSGKLRRYFSWQNFIDPLFVLLGMIQSLFILLRFRPQVIFSKGGYASLPMVLVAFLVRAKVVLHESDSRMGLANRIAATRAHVICVAFPALIKSDKRYVLSGNPLRKEILHGKEDAGFELTGFNRKLPRLLIWGGSQGAEEVNNLLSAHFDDFMKHFQVVHITGKGKAINRHHKHYKSYEYLGEELKHIYAITDMIVGRAGANSIFEVALLKKPNVIIPLANEDQKLNAKYFNEKGCAIIYKPGDNLFDITWDLWQNDALKTSMKRALAILSKPHAAEDIADIILKL